MSDAPPRCNDANCADTHRHTHTYTHTHTHTQLPLDSPHNLSAQDPTQALLPRVVGPLQRTESDMRLESHLRQTTCPQHHHGLNQHPLPSTDAGRQWLASGHSCSRACKSTIILGTCLHYSQVIACCNCMWHSPCSSRDNHQNAIHSHRYSLGRETHSELASPSLSLVSSPMTHNDRMINSNLRSTRGDDLVKEQEIRRRGTSSGPNTVRLIRWFKGAVDVTL